MADKKKEELPVPASPVTSTARDEESRRWAAERFGIPFDSVVFHNSGICYDTIVVTSKEAADKVTEKVKGQFANGGWFDGMPLGGQTEQNDGTFRVYC